MEQYVVLFVNEVVTLSQGSEYLHHHQRGLPLVGLRGALFLGLLSDTAIGL